MIFILQKRHQITVWKNNKKLVLAAIISFVLCIATSLIFLFVGNVIKKKNATEAASSSMGNYKMGKPEIIKEFLTPNEFSRPQDKLDKVNAIVIHYTANPGASAEGNRNYFENLKEQKPDSQATYASSHFIVGLEGEIIQCIPLKEMSYASNERNVDTISIECCHPDETGKFTDETYDSLLTLVSWLMTRYDLQKSDIIRHYDVTGKICPKYYVDNEKAWKKLKEDVIANIKEKGKQKESR